MCGIGGNLINRKVEECTRPGTATERARRRVIKIIWIHATGTENMEAKDTGYLQKSLQDMRRVLRASVSNVSNNERPGALTGNLKPTAASQSLRSYSRNTRDNHALISWISPAHTLCSMG